MSLDGKFDDVSLHMQTYLLENKSKFYLTQILDLHFHHVLATSHNLLKFLPYFLLAFLIAFHFTIPISILHSSEIRTHNKISVFTALILVAGGGAL